MTLSTIKFDGRFVDLILTEDIGQDEVVIQGNIIGVALTSGVQGEKITIDTEGVKLLTASTSIAIFVGDEVLWDTSLKVATTVEGDDTILIGTAMSDKELTDTEIEVKLHSFLTTGSFVSEKEIRGASVGVMGFGSDLKATTIDSSITGKILTSNGPSELASFKDHKELEDDTSPKLGGNLDLNGNSFVDSDGNKVLEFFAATNAVNNLIISNSVTGAPTITSVGPVPTTGDINLRLHSRGGTSHIELYNSNNVHGKYRFEYDGGTTGTTLTLAQSQIENRTITFPDASGTLALTSELGISSLVEDTTPQLGGDLDLNTNNITQNGKNILSGSSSGATVNYFNIKAQISGRTPVLEVAGPDTTIHMSFRSRGAGSFIVFGNDPQGDLFVFDSSLLTTFVGAYRLQLPDGFINTNCVFPLTSTTLIGDDTSDVLSNKTITSGKYNQLNDGNGKKALDFNISSSAVNNIRIRIVTDHVQLEVIGTGSNGEIRLKAQGTGAHAFIRGGNDNAVIRFNLTDLNTAKEQIFKFSGDNATFTMPSQDTTLIGNNTSDELTNKTITSGKYNQLNDVNGNGMFVFAPIEFATEHVEIFNAINVNQGAVGLKVNGSALNTNLDFISRGDASQVRFSNDTNGGQLGIRTNSSTAAKTMTLESQHTEDRTIQIPDATGTLALTSELGISALVDDTSPKLGGNLDLNGKNLVDGDGNEILEFFAATNAVNNLIISNSATGAPTITSVGSSVGDINLRLHSRGGTSHIELYNSTNLGGRLQFFFDGGTNGTTLTLAQSQAIDVTVTFPAATGTLLTTANIGFAVQAHDSDLDTLAGVNGYSSATASVPAHIHFAETTLNGNSVLVLSGATALASNISVTLPSVTGTLALTSETISALVDDESPKLGGNLNVDTFNIVDANGNTLLHFTSTPNAENNLSIFNGINTEGGVVGLGVISVNTNTDFVIESHGPSSGLIIETNVANGKLRLITGNSTTFTTTTLDFKQTLDRTIAFPDATTTLIGTETTDTLKNKSIDGAQNTITNIGDTEVKGQIIDGRYAFSADAGSSDAYVITLIPVPDNLAIGQMFTFSANTANTGPCTLAVNGQAATAIVKQFNVALVTGDIVAGQFITVVFDGTNFQVQSPLAQ